MAGFFYTLTCRRSHKCKYHKANCNHSQGSVLFTPYNWLINGRTGNRYFKLNLNRKEMETDLWTTSPHGRRHQFPVSDAADELTDDFWMKRRQCDVLCERRPSKRHTNTKADIFESVEVFFHQKITRAAQFFVPTSKETNKTELFLLFLLPR